MERFINIEMVGRIMEKKFDKKETGKYIVEINYSVMGYKGRTILTEEYQSNLSLEKVTQIAQDRLTEELRARNLTHGLIYKIYQNIPIIEKKLMTSGDSSDVKKRKNLITFTNHIQ